MIQYDTTKPIIPTYSIGTYKGEHTFTLQYIIGTYTDILTSIKSVIVSWWESQKGESFNACYVYPFNLEDLNGYGMLNPLSTHYTRIHIAGDWLDISYYGPSNPSGTSDNRYCQQPYSPTLWKDMLLNTDTAVLQFSKSLNKYHNFLDLPPFTKAYFKLPFVNGYKDIPIEYFIDYDDTISRYMGLRFSVEIITGKCKYTLFVGDDNTERKYVISYDGQVGYQLPTGKSNYQQIGTQQAVSGITSVLSLVGGIAMSVATENPAPAVLGFMGAGASAVRIGGMEAQKYMTSTGAMSTLVDEVQVLYPYIIIDSPIAPELDKDGGQTFYSIYGYKSQQDVDGSLLYSTTQSYKEFKYWIEDFNLLDPIDNNIYTKEEYEQFLDLIKSKDGVYIIQNTYVAPN